MADEQSFLYLSYKGAEPEALALIDRLRTDGCRLRSDTRAGGDDQWLEAQGEALQQCSMFLTLLTEQHLKNDWCKRDLLTALRRADDCPILVVHFSNQPLSPGMTLALAGLRDLRRDTYDSDDALYYAICASAGMAACFPDGIAPAPAPTEVQTISYQNGEYHGETLDGKQHGKGVCRYDDGRVYSGQWRLGLRHGEGTITWPSGMRYAGRWANDKISGEGRMEYPKNDREGRAYHIGHWENGVPKGHGVLVMRDGSRRAGIWSGRRLITEEEC